MGRAGPLEPAARNLCHWTRCDCEDYAIAKYVALTEAGIAADDVKLVIVRNTAAREDHAVTAVRLDDDWITLDNRWLTPINDVDMPQAVPLFVLDQAGARKFEPAAMAHVRRAARPASLDF
jgi:transglutaminase-like cysteine proteinase BTLCP